MKKVVFVFTIMFCAVSGFSQLEEEPKEVRLKYGFSLGTNYTSLHTPDKLSENTEMTSGTGLNLGIVGEYKISDHFFLLPKAELSFNKGEVIFTNADATKTVYKVMPVGLNFMAHVMVKSNTGKLQPYFFAGPTIKTPVVNNQMMNTTYPNPPDVAIDFGIGMEKVFADFAFAPEVRYSYGLRNVNGHPALQSLYMHSISLILNFKG